MSLAYSEKFNVTSCVKNQKTGDFYLTGCLVSNRTPFLARYSNNKQMQWCVSFEEDICTATVQSKVVKINPVTNNPVVMLQFFGNTLYCELIEVDVNDAAIVYACSIRDSAGYNDFNLHDFDFMHGPNPVVVGGRYNEYRSLAVIPHQTSGQSTLVVMKSDYPGLGITTSQWFVCGTGIGNGTSDRSAIIDIKESDLTWTLTTSVDVQFDDPGDWNLVYMLGQEGFIARLNDQCQNIVWSNNILSENIEANEFYKSLVIDQNDNIYTIGTMYADNDAVSSLLNNILIAVVSKFDPDGNIIWSLALNNSADNCYGENIALINNNLIVTYYNERREMFVTILTSSGHAITTFDNEILKDNKEQRFNTKAEVYNSVLQSAQCNIIKSSIKTIKI